MIDQRKKVCMTEIATSPALKKPVGVYIIAVLFLLAPLGNILISFAGSGVSGWYDPAIFTSLLDTIPPLEWVWLGLLFLSGILLFRPHKLSWSLAIFTLLLILCINIYRMYSGDQSSIDLRYLKVFSIIALLCTVGVLVVSFYFRFPYLDRRANWVKNIERFDFKTEAEVNDLKAVTESLSMTGCKLRLTSELNVVKGDLVKIKLNEVSNLSVNGRVIEYANLVMRLEFESPSDSFRSSLKSWITKKQNV